MRTRASLPRFTRMGARASKWLGLDVLDCADLDPFSGRLPLALPSLDIQGVASFIRDAQAPIKIVVLAGSGISTAAGIPDFRSPSAGLYATLAARGFSHKPETIFSRDVFDHNPQPLYDALCAMWAEGDDSTGRTAFPTATHHFLAMLDARGMLSRIYTQNVDGLERRAGVRAERVVQVHGSMHEAYCDTSAGQVDVPIEELRAALLKGEEGPGGWRALAQKYGGFVRPAVCLFGEPLPAEFAQMAARDLTECDLLIVMGTHLKVEPAASLVNSIRVDVPRLVINRTRLETRPSTAAVQQAELMGACEAALNSTLHFGESNHRNVEFLGDCDDGCRALARCLGPDWAKELAERATDDSIMAAVPPSRTSLKASL